MRHRRGELVRPDTDVGEPHSELVTNVENEADETTPESVREWVRVNVQAVLRELDSKVDTPSKAIKMVGELLSRSDIDHIIEEVLLDEIRQTDDYKIEEERRRKQMRARPVRTPKEVKQPTTIQRAQHNVTHIPYEPWCNHCRNGKSHAGHHRSVDRSADEQAIVGMECYFSGTEEPETAQDIAEDIATAISLKEGRSGAIFSKIVPGKHLSDPWTAMEMGKAIEWLGHKRITLRCDQEPAIVALAK